MNEYSIDEPYLRFAIAMIERAIEDCKLKKKMLEGKLTWLDTLNTDPEYWLFESKEEEFPSFLSLCCALGCDPGYLRKLIRGHLLECDITIGMSAVEILRRKIRKEKVIIRYHLVKWAWGNLGVKKKSLNNLVRVLVERGEVEEKKKKSELGRLSRYYYWVGD